jgi:PAS domain S-box-containing protein
MTREELLEEIARLESRISRMEVADTSYRPQVNVEVDENFFSAGNNLANIVLTRIEDFVYYVEIGADGTKTIRYVGPQLESVLGISRGQYTSDATVIIDNCHPDDLPGIYETARRLRVERKPQHFIYRYRHNQKGDYIWLEETVYPQFDETGFYFANLGIIRDITERKKTENDLRESRLALERVLNTIDEVVYHIDSSRPAGQRVKFVSGNLEKIFGVTREEFMSGKSSFLNYCHPDDIDFIRKTSEELRNDKQAKTYFYRFLHRKTNQYIWIEERVIPGYDEQGNQFEIFGVARDVTARKEAEEMLMQSHESYRTLVEEIADGIVIAGFDQKIVFANKAVLEITGIKTREELIGRSLLEYLSPQQQKRSAERIRDVIEGKRVPFEIVEILHPNGSIVECESRPSLYTYMGKQTILVFLRNITAERMLEKEQMRAQLAEETNLRLQNEIIERTRAERELSAAQTNLRLLIDSSIDMICASDNEGFITEFNKAAQKTFGYSKEEVLGKHVSFLYENPKQRIDVTHELMEGSGFFTGEVNNRKKNGEVFTALLSASVLRDENGKVVGTMGVSRDITDSMRAEKELRLSEEKYRAIYNQAYIGIALVDTETDGYLDVNQRLSDMLGYSPEELRQKTVHDLRLPGDLSRLPSGKDFIIRGFERIIDEHRYRHKNGNDVIVNVTISLVRSEDQRPLYFVYVYEDLTPKRRAEEQIRLQAAKLNAIFESSSHMIWTVDRNHRMTSFNRNQADWLRRSYGLNAYIGMSMNSGRMVSSSEYNNFWMQKIEAALAGTAQHFETSFREPNGETTWREIFLNPIFDDAENVVEISAIAHDVTDKKQAEETLKQSLKEKEVLLKEVHHRVKNNLQVISSILNLQSSYVRDKRILEILIESQNRIKSMAFVHESLYQTKDFSNISFQEYVGNISRNLVHSYSSSENPPDLKLDLDPVKLHLDTAIPCGLIINELLSNALKYAFRETTKGEISISVKQKENRVTIIVADNGVGLPPDLDFRNTESLGLQLVISLVEQINGKIKADTKKGTKFTIEFDAPTVNA